MLITMEPKHHTLSNRRKISTCFFPMTKKKQVKKPFNLSVLI